MVRARRETTGVWVDTTTYFSTSTPDDVKPISAALSPYEGVRVLDWPT
jgi:hypothetical protein